MYSCHQIAGILQAKIYGKADYQINNILTDSRKLVSPEDSMFFALTGERHDGHLFISDLYQTGVKCFTVSRLPKEIHLFPEACFLLAENTLEALHQVAAFHRSHFQYPVVAITGSNGKTIVKEWMAQMLGSELNLVRSPKSYNSQIGVPLSVWKMNTSHGLAIFEAGISMPGEMEKLEKIICPDIGIFTHLGQAHQENFKDLEEKAREKLLLFKNCKTIIFPADEEIPARAIDAFRFSCQVKKLCWSEKKKADLEITSRLQQHGETIIEGIYEKRKVTVTIPFTDEASFCNAVSVWLFMLFMGKSDEWIAVRMKLLTGIAMRLEMKKGRNNCTIINDSYNSDPGSLQIALDFLQQQNQHREKVLILSDILQSGMRDEELYQQVSKLVKQKNINQLIGIGPAISKYSNMFQPGSVFFKNAGDFLTSALIHQFADKAILLKGARKFEFEHISEMLQYQAHRTVFEINLNALEHNFNFFKSLLHRQTKICAMVKAFSYGAGTFEIANLLQFLRADYLAVAFADEGISLRRNGITCPVIIMNPDPGAFDMMMEFNLEPEIYSMRLLDLFTEAVKQNNITGYPVHIKFDTGMHRSGFTEDETELLASKLNESHWLKPVSVFTHLAAADEVEHDDFTLSQMAIFDRMYNIFIRHTSTRPLRHVLNSAGIERFPQHQYDMVRLGIGLYGIGCKYGENLQEIGSLKSTVMQLKKINPDETVGYGRKGKIKQPTEIATVPVGYADGLRRNLSNGTGYMMIRGNKAPIVGNICMDMTMIDVTGLNVKEGDEVVIFGEGLPVTRVAELCGTIPYEILTGISPRVKRVYFKE